MMVDLNLKKISKMFVKEGQGWTVLLTICFPQGKKTYIKTLITHTCWAFRRQKSSIELANPRIKK